MRNFIPNLDIQRMANNENTQMYTDNQRLSAFSWPDVFFTKVEIVNSNSRSCHSLLSNLI